jgi:hypothetical protein
MGGCLSSAISTCFGCRKEIDRSLTVQRSPIEITVKFLNGKSITLGDVDPSSYTIVDIKKRICSINPMFQVDRTVLLFKGNLYKNSRTLEECEIGNDSVLYAQLNLGGPNNKLLQKYAV